MHLASPLSEIDSPYVTDRDRDVARHCLAVERARLSDPRHLVERVLGRAEFDWDFEPIGPGFLALVTPFMESPSGAGALFHAVLREYGIEATKARHAIALLEYSHFATRINDHFNYHDEFAKRTPDRATAERLVQLRYGAQWLNNYSRWLIIANELGAERAALIAVHRSGNQAVTATGISRASFLRFSRTGFKGVTPSQWLALAPSLLCEIVISPASLATILAGRSTKDLKTVKRAFSHLAVALKLRLERRALDRGPAESSSPVRDVELPMRFPGTAVLSAGAAARVEIAPLPGERFPRVHAACAAMARAVDNNDALAHALRASEREHVTSFRSVLDSSKILTKAAASLASAFERE